MDSEKIVLYGYFQSSATYRLRMAMNLKKIEYDTISFDLVKAEQKNEEFAKINPHMRVPAMKIDGIYLTESTVILEYLEETRGGPALIPKEPKLRAKARQLAQIINAGLQPYQNLPVLMKIKELGGDSKEWAVDVHKLGFNAFSKLIEGNEGRYCIGDEITIADLCLVPQLYNARRHGIDIEKDFPHLFKIDQELQKVPEIAAAHPYKQPDYPGPN